MNNFIKAITLTAVTGLIAPVSGCALFRPCECEKIPVEPVACVVPPSSSDAPGQDLPSAIPSGDPTTTKRLSRSGAGEIEPSSALELDNDSFADSDDHEDDHDSQGSHEGYEGDEIDDEVPANFKDGLPPDITSSQMDQILPSHNMRQRIDIPDSARDAIQIPVLTAIRPSDPDWATEIVPRVRDLSIKDDNGNDLGLRALTGNFLSRYSGTSTSIVTPGSQLEIYSPGRPTMKRNISVDYRSPLVQNLWPYPMYAAQLVEDEPLEIVVIGIDKEGETDAVVMTVYKVFGNHIGRVFEAEIGLVSNKKIIKTAQIEFVAGKNDIGIRRTPIDSKGTPDKAHAVVYDWNPWEGSFRENHPPERSLGKPKWMEEEEPQQ